MVENNQTKNGPQKNSPLNDNTPGAIKKSAITRYDCDPMFDVAEIIKNFYSTT